MASTEQRIEDARKQLEVAQKFLSDLERIGFQVPEGLRRAVDRYAYAVNMGLDAAQAAEEVSQRLKGFYAEAYQACKQRSDDGLEDYYACIAGVDRKWQAINTSAVLNWNDHESFVRKVWHRWRERLSKTLGDWAKGVVKERAQGASQ